MAIEKDGESRTESKIFSPCLPPFLSLSLYSWSEILCPIFISDHALNMPNIYIMADICPSQQLHVHDREKNLLLGRGYTIMMKLPIQHSLCVDNVTSWCWNRIIISKEQRFVPPQCTELHMTEQSHIYNTIFRCIE